jgi:hypothetical protein
MVGWGGNGIPQEELMRAIRVMAFIAAIALFMGVAVGDALAGEKVKGQIVSHTLKWEQINVGDEDGHVVAVYEGKGITTNSEGKGYLNGFPYQETSLLDINLKTGLGSGHGYGYQTDRDGDKVYWTWEGRRLQGGKFGTGYWAATWTYVKGTGKFEGIQGKGTSQGYNIGGDNLIDFEGDVVLPR